MFGMLQWWSSLQSNHLFARINPQLFRVHCRLLQSIELLLWVSWLISKLQFQAASLKILLRGLERVTNQRGLTTLFGAIFLLSCSHIFSRIIMMIYLQSLGISPRGMSTSCSQSGWSSKLALSERWLRNRKPILITTFNKHSRKSWNRSKWQLL